jgi:hypothetical protein
MENENIVLAITPAQLDYLIELTTLDVALSLMKVDKLETPKVKARLELRINANKILLHQLKAKQNECCKIR